MGASRPADHGHSQCKRPSDSHAGLHPARGYREGRRDRRQGRAGLPRREAALVEEERLRIKKEYERREKNVELETKIANATETNKNKLLVLQAAAVQVENTYAEAYEALKAVPNKPEYQSLLVELIKEGVAMLGLGEVKVICRAADKAKVMQAIGQVQGVKINVDDQDLKVDPSVTNVDSQCIGGVLVSSMDGKVVVSQTLNARLQVAYDTALPVVKPVLFNQQGSKHTDKY